MDEIIVKAAIILTFYNISGFATTNMLRLLKGARLTVLHSKCYCDSCGKPISVFGQLPVISYICYRGKCRHCKAKIPISGLILELSVFFGMSLIGFVFGFTPAAVLLCYLYYEAIKIFLIIKNGKRESGFFAQYLISLSMTFIMFILTEFMALLLKTL